MNNDLYEEKLKAESNKTLKNSKTDCKSFKRKIRRNCLLKVFIIVGGAILGFFVLVFLGAG